MQNNLTAVKIRKSFKFPHRNLDMNDSLALIQAAKGSFKFGTTYGIDQDNWLQFVEHTTLIPVEVNSPTPEK